LRPPSRRVFKARMATECGDLLCCDSLTDGRVCMWGSAEWPHRIRVAGARYTFASGATCVFVCAKRRHRVEAAVCRRLSPSCCGACSMLAARACAVPWRERGEVCAVIGGCCEDGLGE